MKLSLQVVSPSGVSHSRDTRQSPVAIGRDPAGAVVLEGDSAKGVSWNHARIEIDGKRLSITDLGSSNGTLVNDKPIVANQITRIAMQDRIQLGYTGPKIRIAAFEADLTQETFDVRHPIEPEPRTPAWKLAALALLGILLPVLAYFAFSSRKDAKPDKKDEIAYKGDEKPPVPAPVPAKDEPPRGNAPPVASPMPAMARGMAGRNAKSADDPGTLLQWAGEPFPWTPLANGDRVNYGTTLLALAGFRCKVDLDTGLRVVALSSIPEFDSKAPVFETVWMHDAPPPGYDGRILFDRGRIWLANGKTGGPCKIQLQLRNADWEITLADAKSEAVVECWFDLPVAPKFGIPGLPTSEPVIGFFTRGKVELKSGGKSYPLQGVQFLFQEGNARKIVQPHHGHAQLQAVQRHM